MMIRVLLVLTFAIPLFGGTAGTPRLTFTHWAGSDGGSGSEDGRGSFARFWNPAGISTDADDNLYVADLNNHTIRRIAPDGTVTTLAGLAGVPGEVDGRGAFSLFYAPGGTAVDPTGNVYVADILNHVIRKIAPDGTVSVFAGEYNGYYDGIGSDSAFSYPSDVAADNLGNLYVADTGNQVIRKITPSGQVTTLAGAPHEEGWVDGTGRAAKFRTPEGVAVDSSGNVYVADTRNDAIRKITPDGKVTTLAGSNKPGHEDGPGSQATFYRPTGVTVGSGGNIYVADTSNHLIRKITTAGVVSTIAGGEGFDNGGSDDGTGRNAKFGAIFDITADSTGDLYVADSTNNTVRKVTPEGVVTTIAGKAAVQRQVDGPLADARFLDIRDMTLDPNGDVILIDGHTIRKIRSDGMVETLLGVEPEPAYPEYVDGSRSAARFDRPVAIASAPTGELFVVEGGAHTLRRINTDLSVSTFAGKKNTAGREDGTLTEARFRFPSDVAVDRDGTVYVSDDCTVRRISDGMVTTMLGRPVPPARGCTQNIDGPFATATLEGPSDLVIDDAGNIYLTTVQTFGGSYVATTRNTIRKLTPDGFATTVAGDDGKGERYRDAIGRSAQFYNIGSIALDAEGGIYVSEFVADTVRWVGPTRAVTTIGGIPGGAGTAPGTTQTARFLEPDSMVMDRSGNLLIAEGGIRIRIARPALEDDALIDAWVAVSGGTRQLDATPSTATSWTWEMLRMPSVSQSSFSSASIRNPTFVPDVEDLFEFRVTADNGAATSITSAYVVTDEGVETPAGSGIEVAGPDSSLTFPRVDRAGRTLIAQLPIAVSLPDTLPSWLVFDLTTTAEFTSPAVFCVSLPASANPMRISEFRIFQREGEEYRDRTTSSDAGTICANLPSLGRVALGGPAPRRRAVRR